MARHAVDFGTATIPNGQTESAVLESKSGFGALVDLNIFAPATLTGTVTLKVAPKESPVSGDFVTQQIAGADVTIPAGRATPIPVASFKALKLVSSGAEGADRAFRIIGQVDVAIGGVY